MTTGESFSRHRFWSSESADEGHGSPGQRSSIRCVEELFPGEPERTAMLAICLESWESGERPMDAKTQVLIYSIPNSRVLRRFHLPCGLHCSALTFLDRDICDATRVARFDGCLAVATKEGIVLLVDLNSDSLVEQPGRRCSLSNSSSEGDPCYGEIFSFPGEELEDRFNLLLDECRSKGAHLAVRLSGECVACECNSRAS